MEMFKTTFGDEMSLKHIHEFYLCCDVSLLADVWVSFCELIKKSFGTHPSNFLTGPGLVFKSALKMGKTDIEQLTDYSQYQTWESCIRGGLVCVTKRHIECNNIDLKTYDKSKKDIFLIFVDFNGLYAEMLTKPLPYGNFEYVDVGVFKDEKYILSIDTSDDATTGYLITASIEIPEN